MRTGGESSKWAVKAKGIAKAVVYLALAWTSFSFTKEQPSSSKKQSSDFTATLPPQQQLECGRSGRPARGLVGAFVEDETISEPLDFFGINYYERHLVTTDPADPVRGWTRVPDPKPTTVGIGVHPEGLREVLERVSADYTDLPLFVTETGICLHDYVDPEEQVKDDQRVEFFDSHIRAAHQAIQNGVNLAGFFPWSLMDNYEWAWGYAYRFGMYYVDYATQERIPKRSAQWFSKITRANGID